MGDIVRYYVRVLAINVAISILAFACTAVADDDILNNTAPPLTVSPPQGVTFSNFTGEVFSDTQSEEPVNQQVGAGWLRNKSATWPNVSGSSCGKFNWAGNRQGENPDQDILYAHSHGQEYLLDLAYTAPCAWSAACQKIRGAQCEYHAPGKLTDWSDYVSAVVAHYAAPPFNVKYFQIWNEPGDPTNLFWRVTDGGDPGHEFVDQIYNPAAAIIHSHGGQVVFSGWACDIGNSNWRKCEQHLNEWLSYHQAWSNTDYIDLHYAPLYVWQELYPTWVASGKVKGLWQTEIGGTFPQGPLPGDLPLVYLTAMYWALSSGGWNESNPDRYKLFWFPGLGPQGGVALTMHPAGARLSVLKPRGTYHTVLHELFGGGALAAYSHYKTNLPSYPAANGSVGFTVGQHQIVIALFPTNGNQPMNIGVPLSTPASSVTFINATGDPVQNFRYTQDGGVLNATGNSGSSLSLAYLLSINMGPSQAQTPNAEQPATKASTTAQQNAPAEYQAGIAQLRIAKGYLEAAGEKWGGYRDKGIASIDQAFKALGVSHESTPQKRQSGNVSVDEPGVMNSGISALQAARADFAKAGNDWGGRKENAVALIDQALKDLQTGITWAKKHKTY